MIVIEVVSLLSATDQSLFSGSNDIFLVAAKVCDRNID